MRSFPFVVHGTVAALLVVVLTACPNDQVAVTIETPTIFAPNPLVNTNPLRIVGGKPAGTQVLILVDGQDAPLKTGELDDSSSWAFDMPLSEGENRFVLVARDGADHLSEPSAPVLIKLDTVAPAVPTVADAPTRVVIPVGAASASVVLHGTKEAGAGLRVNEEEVLAAADATTSWAYTFDIAAPGATLNVTSHDSAGNASAAVEVVIAAGGDIDLPVAPTLLDLPADVQLVEGETTRLVTVHGNKESNASVLLGGVELVALDAETTWQAALEVIPGDNAFVFTSKDEAGNESLPTSGPVYAIPFLPAPTLNGAPGAANQSPLAVNGTKPHDLLPTGVSIRSGNDGAWANLTDVDDTGAWSAGVDIRTLPTFFLAARTARGDIGEVAGPFSIVFDNVAPPAPTVDTIPLILISTGSTSDITVSGGTERGTAVRIERLPAGSAPAVDGIVDAVDLARWTARVNIPVGDSTLRFSAVDRAGNVSAPTEKTVTARVGITPPTVSLPNQDVNTTTVTLTGTRPRGAAVRLRREGEVDGAVVVAGGDAGTLYSVDFELLAEGSNRFFLNSEDGARRSIEIGPLTIVRDTIAPEPPLIVDPPAQVEIQNLVIAGTKSEFRSQVCVQANREPSCRTVVSSSAPINFEVTERLVDGENRLCFSSVDEAGNKGADRCIVTTLGTAPTLAIVSPNQGQMVATADVEVVVEAFGSPTSPIASVSACIGTLCVDGQPTGDPTAGRYAIPVVLPSSTDTTLYTVEVTATNSAGREAVELLDVLFFVRPFEVFSNSNQAVVQRSDGVKIAVDRHGEIHLVWIDNCFSGAFANSCNVPFVNDGNPPIGKQVFYTHGDGATFAPVVNLSDLAGSVDAASAAIVVDAVGDVHVVWVDSGTVLRETNNSSDLDLIHRVISGVDGSLGSARLVTIDDGALGVNDTAPALAADSLGRVHLAYLVTNQNLQSTIAARVFDGGVWSNAVNVSDATVTALAPSVAVNPANDNAVPYVAWVQKSNRTAVDGDVVMRAVGAQLGDVVNLSADAANSTEVDLAADSAGFIHAAWRDIGGSVIHYRNSETGSATVPLGAVVDVTAGGTAAQGASIAVNDDTGAVLVAWVETSAGGQPDVYTSSFDGLAFATPTKLFTAALSAKYTDLTNIRAKPPIDLTILSGQNAYFAWSMTDLRGTGSTDNDDDVWMTIQAAP